MSEVNAAAGHVFLSYARDDSEHVDRLQPILEAAGIRVWRDTADMWPGQDWQATVRRAITNDALVFLACFSTKSARRTRSYQRVELLLAIDELRRRDPESSWLIPVRFDACEIPDRDLGGGRSLRTVQRVDLFGDGYDEAVSRLVAGIIRVLASARPGYLGSVARSHVIYRRQAQELAPTSLQGRMRELMRIANFCRSDGSYAWWQAGPWAGKTALLAWTACHPPTGVDVISYFITTRLSTHASSDVFVESVIDQAAALMGVPVPSGPTAARHALMLTLLDRASEISASDGRKLLLIVDGLDEDACANSSDQPSVMSLLPKLPAAAMRVLLASRPSPGIPMDVADDHPLRAVAMWALRPSRHAQTIELAAKGEMTKALRRSSRERDVLGFVTASGGGLSLTDLEELTAAPPYELEVILAGPLGRTVAFIAGSMSFAHETLASMAAEGLGRALHPYRARLDQWASSYAESHWPDATPTYLLREYFELLEAHDDLAVMFSYAWSSKRHDRLFELTGGDHAALTEIKRTRAKILARGNPDLNSLLHLAYREDELYAVNEAVPPGLPRILAKLGYVQNAEALAHGSGSSAEASRGLAMLAAVFAATDRLRETKSILDEVSDPGWLVFGLIAAFEDLVNKNQAELLKCFREALEIIQDNNQRVEPLAMARLAILMKSSSSLELRSALMRFANYNAGSMVKDTPVLIPSSLRQTFLLDALKGRHDAALRSIRGIQYPAERLSMFAEVTAVLAPLQPVLASSLVTEIIAETTSNPRLCGPTVVLSLVEAEASLGRYDSAGYLATQVVGSQYAMALTLIATQALQAGDRDVAAIFARQAHRAVRGHDPIYVTRIIVAVTAAVAEFNGNSVLAAVFIDKSAEMVSSFLPASDSGRSEGTTMLAKLVQVSCDAGEDDRAFSLLSVMGNEFERGRASEAAVASLLAHGNLPGAERLAGEILDADWRTGALTRIARAAAEAGDAQRGSRFANAASEVASAITYDVSQIIRRGEIADVLMMLGREEEACSYLNQLTGGFSHWDESCRARLACSAAYVGRLDVAKELLKKSSGEWQLRGLSEVAAIAFASGRHTETEYLLDLAETIAVKNCDTEALLDLADAAVGCLDLNRFARLSRGILKMEDSIRSRAGLAGLWARADEPARALKMLPLRDMRLTTFNALMEIANSYFRNGEEIQVRLIIGKAEDWIYRFRRTPNYDFLTREGLDHSLIVLTREYCALGDDDSALRLASQEPSAKRRVRALCGGAEEFAKLGDTCNSAKLLSHTLASESWMYSLDTVARLWPDIFADFATKLLADVSDETVSYRRVS